MSTPTPSSGLPRNQGLYDPWFEHDACGVGFIVDMKGRRSHRIVADGLQILRNLDHRGASGAEINTGDGAGILIQLPHKFFVEGCKSSLRFTLPAAGQYGAGLIYLPRNASVRRKVEEKFEQLVQSESCTFLGWRTVPTKNASLGDTAKSSEPFMRQCFIARPEGLDELGFERKLYVIRKRAYTEIRTSTLPGSEAWYTASLSMRTLVYKGMLTTEQVDNYFPDLKHPAMESALALVHSRFSTNTFPSWPLAHPYRYLAHNGEINTLKGNRNWMRAREALLESDLFPGDLSRIFPVCTPAASDSASFDEALELLHLGGRPLHHAVLMMIPEAWENNPGMDPAKRAFYQFHASMMEPWDGPASVAFTDGTVIGAVLDRNGLRPSRYWVTDDDLVVMASEVGVIDVDPAHVVRKGRLQPGRMFLIDTAAGRIVDDAEIKRALAAERPYAEWLDEGLVEFAALPAREHLVFSHD